MLLNMHHSSLIFDRNEGKCMLSFYASYYTELYIKAYCRLSQGQGIPALLDASVDHVAVLGRPQIQFVS